MDLKQDNICTHIKIDSNRVNSLLDFMSADFSGMSGDDIRNSRKDFRDRYLDIIESLNKIYGESMDYYNEVLKR